jgi:NADH-quinone oxidoreductase subunit J
MELSHVFFYAFSVLLIGIGLVVAFSKNLLHSAFALFFVLFTVAGFYVLLGADFLAMVQVMVYAGGVSVLLIFGTMLTADISEPETSNLSFQAALTVISGAAVLGLILWVFNQTDWNVIVPGAREATTASIGKLLLGQYILPFEVISFLLLAAMIGALMLVMKGDRK